jgi:triacylglycerol lipase
MPLSTANTPAANFGNAQLLATAAELAYYPADVGVPKYQEQLGLKTQLISVDNTQAYVGGDAGTLVVAFRGSQSPTSLDGVKDWLLTNANNFLIVPEGRIGTDFMAAGVGARFHRGFMEALAEIWEPLVAAVQAEQDANERPLFVCGHSLGGALALLASWRFQRQFLPVFQLCTYGAPMVGNAAAVAAIDKEFAGRILRFVDAPDLVPRLPMISLIANAYGHCQREIALDSGLAAGAGNALELIALLAKETADGVLNATLHDKLWALVNSRLTAHDVVNYRGLIAKCEPR